MQKVSVKALAGTDRGRVRSSNQDAFLLDMERGLFIVADGMGGHAGGEIASQLCVSNVQDYMIKKLKDAGKTPQHPDARLNGFLADAINFSSTSIYERGLEEPKLKGMGTTATVLKVEDAHAYIGHVGDSRLYLLRCGYIYQITFDHSLVSEQVRLGMITKEEAERHHLKNVITRSVGFQEEEDVDTTYLALENDDILILCSDGLHGKVRDSEIAQICLEDFPNSPTQLIGEANARGGEDNITVVVVRIKFS